MLRMLIPLHTYIFSQTTFIHGAIILTRVTDVAVATVAAGIDYKTFKEFFIKSISFPIVNNAQSRNCHVLHLRRILMASLNYRASLQANKQPRGSDSSCYSFHGKRLKSQSKCIVMNVMEYFENEAKKSKGHPNILDKVCKATGKAAITLKSVWKSYVL